MPPALRLHRLRHAWLAALVCAATGLLPAWAAKPARKTARLDPLIDAIATLALEAPVTGDLALVHLPPSRRAGTKPFLIEGLNAATGEWELPVAGQRYGEFQAGVQMANRSGALNEIEYSEFVQKLQAFADGVGAMAELPDMLDVVARARELDAFAGGHDAQLSLNLRANAAAWSVGYIQQSAQRQGFVPGVLPGRLVLPGAEDGAPPVLVLGFDPQAALADDPAAAALGQFRLPGLPQQARAVLLQPQIDLRDSLWPLLQGQVADADTRAEVLAFVLREQAGLAARLGREELPRLPSLFRSACSTDEALRIDAGLAAPMARVAGGRAALAGTLEAVRLCSAWRARQGPAGLD